MGDDTVGDGEEGRVTVTEDGGEEGNHPSGGPDGIEVSYVPVQGEANTPSCVVGVAPGKEDDPTAVLVEPSMS